MPTGYTAPIIEGDGITFENFALRCAREFGALIEMRDSSMNATIPEKFEPSDYHAKAKKTSEEELARLDSMDDFARKQFGQHKRDALISEMARSVDKTAEVKKRLETMREKVLQWNPPSQDHVAMKDFMLQQIDETLKWDGSNVWAQTQITELGNRPPLKFWEESRESAFSSIKYHADELAGEIERVESRNRWIRQLRESLKEPAGSTSAADSRAPQEKSAT